MYMYKVGGKGWRSGGGGPTKQKTPPLLKMFAHVPAVADQLTIPCQTRAELRFVCVIQLQWKANYPRNCCSILPLERIAASLAGNNGCLIDGDSASCKTKKTCHSVFLSHLSRNSFEERTIFSACLLFAAWRCRWCGPRGLTFSWKPRAPADLSQAPIPVCAACGEWSSSEAGESSECAQHWLGWRATDWGSQSKNKEDVG